MVTIHIVNDAASIERQRKLLGYFEDAAAEWMATSFDADAARQPALARQALDLAIVAQRTADNIRRRLVAASGLTEGDVAVSAGLSDLMARGPAGDTAWLPRDVVAPPVEYQTYATPVVPDDLYRTVAWLRFDLPEMWWDALPERVQSVALWLLTLRRACWSGRWKTS